MQPYISIITLGVTDLKKSTEFYSKLGFPLQSTDARISFFQLSGMRLALYPKTLLAEDAHTTNTKNGFSGVTLAHNVPSKNDVDKIMNEGQHIGATIVDPAHDRDWGGYSGYFSDPDGYLWEIAWNPYDTDTAER
jgi:predicted lactoylglutathione lyase